MIKSHAQPGPFHLRGLIRIRPAHLTALVFLVWVGAGPATALAQKGDSYQADRDQAVQLCQRNNYAEALPRLEKLTQTDPMDTVVLENLARCLVEQAATLGDAEKSKALLLRARDCATRALKLGDTSTVVQLTLDQVPADGILPTSHFSNRKEVDDLMNQAERAFNSGHFEQARTAYQQAFTLEPSLYEAPLYTGDSYAMEKQFDQAVTWYAKAVAVNPSRETAYRYWGHTLVRAGNLRAARTQLIEALVSEPYNRNCWREIDQWAVLAGVQVAPPAINVPALNLTPESVKAASTSPALDPADPWSAYTVSRFNWIRQDRFHDAYPAEPAYRHSLREESAALSAVADAALAAQAAGKMPQPDPSLVALVKLKQAGLLEAFILITRADEDIAGEFTAYQEQHRDKLRQFLGEFVVPALK